MTISILEARYRVFLKRTLKTAGFGWQSYLTTNDLEGMIKGLAKSNPDYLAEKIFVLFDQAARAWNEGNSSGKSEVMKEKQGECDEIQERAERVLILFGISCDYPGLYPRFLSTVDGYREFHGEVGLVEALKITVDKGTHLLSPR